MAHELLARVEDARALAPARLRLEEELAFLDAVVARLLGGHEAVAAGVPGVGLVGEREPQREQALVDGAEVADLEVGVVEAGGLVAGEVEAHRLERRGEVEVAQLGAFEQFRAGQVVGREQRAVVLREVHRAVALADGLRERLQTVPERAAALVDAVAAVARLAAERAQGVVRVPARPRVGQVPGALGVEHEQQAEQQGVGRLLDVVPHGGVVEGGAFVLRQPLAEAARDVGQGEAADLLVEALFEASAEVARVGLEGLPQAPGRSAAGASSPTR